MELLVVVAIITALIGILVPGLRKVRIMVRDLKQKSQLHNIEIGLELFRDDFDGYPGSSLDDSQGAGNYITGSQILAEAVVGRDLRGCEPHTNWNPALDEALSDTASYASAAKGSTQSEIEVSRNRRMGPYMEMQDIGAYSAGKLWQDTGDVYPGTGNYKSPMITDIYNQVKIQLDSGEQVWAGSPVLYFKANRGTRIFDDNVEETEENQAVLRQWIYNYYDNMPIYKLGSVKDNSIQHFYDPDYTDPDNAQRNGYDVFYEDLSNPKIETYKRPYNCDTFILISAGFDGIYGTGDDMTNFNY